MKTTVICQRTCKGDHCFYLVADGTEYYLFHQDYRKSVHAYYAKGVSLNDALDFGKSHKNEAIMRTMSKLPMYIKYIEKEYGVLVLKKASGKSKKPAERFTDFDYVA